GQFALGPLAFIGLGLRIVPGMLVVLHLSEDHQHAYGAVRAEVPAMRAIGDDCARVLSLRERPRGDQGGEKYEQPAHQAEDTHVLRCGTLLLRNVDKYVRVMAGAAPAFSHTNPDCTCV